jgi:hypothetical protein
MPRFEVHIPAVDTTGFNFTFRVDAETWMAALKHGLKKLGEQGAQGQNILVDIQDDNTLHVTEPESGRVFQIRELSEQEAATAQVKRSPARPAQPAAPPSRPTPPPEPRRPAPQQVTPAHETRTLQEMPVVTALPTRPSPPPGSPPQRAPGASGPKPRISSTTLPAQPAAPDSTVVQRRPSRPAPQSEAAAVVELEQPVRPVGNIGRPLRKRSTREDTENVLAEVFERVQSVNAKRSIDDALYFLLDLALEKIPAEAGTIFRADAASGDLHFAAVRGPKAQELLRARLVVPSGTGIVGFCTTEGVSVALSDVQKDPRYYAAVAARVNYETRSVLAAPMMTQGRTFGCLQLINKQGTPLFTELEVGLAAYIAHQAALYLASRVAGHARPPVEQWGAPRARILKAARRTGGVNALPLRRRAGVSILPVRWKEAHGQCRSRSPRSKPGSSGGHWISTCTGWRWS